MDPGHRRPAAGARRGQTPRYLLESSPFWLGYEVEAGLPPTWDRPLLTVGSVYSVYGPSFLTDDPAAVAHLVDDVRAQSADHGAAGAMVFNLPEPQARRWAAVREPDAVIRLDMSYYRLPSVGADPVMGDVKQHPRSEWRRRWRRATERGVKLVERFDADDAQIDRVLELTNGSAVKHGWPALYDRDTLAAVLSVPGARLIQAEWQGSTIGAWVALEHDERLYLWAGGTDHTVYKEVSPYPFMMYEVLAQAVERGWRQVEFGRGNDEFKVRHGFDGIGLWSLWYAAHPEQVEVYRPRLEALHASCVQAQGEPGRAAVLG
ncbi:GNAT family N-acetyltransferase [Actinokineospora soli]|uniref:GNAT family N-acetyltransferase n=1 Tax=Actinokineospora soli TaxID=1048753 RepID=A0ABW2TIG6_9PSEU